MQNYKYNSCSKDKRFSIIKLLTISEPINTDKNAATPIKIVSI